MATKTFTCDKDTSLYEPNLGNGAEQHLPVGMHSSGNLFRALLHFALDFSDVVTITAATLHLKSTSQVHIAFGSSPTIRVKRLTSAFTGSGGSEGTWSSSANPDWGSQPGSTTTDQSGADNVGSSESAWSTTNIVSILNYWLGGGTNYGILVKADSEASTADSWEFYSRNSSYDPYITITYTTNSAPAAPTGGSPTAGVLVAGVDPTIAFDHVDSDGDALLNYDLQVSTDPTFATATHFDGTGQTTGIVANHVSRAYSTLLGATALTRGVTYYWRARTYSATGMLTAGAWSAAHSFKTNTLPVATLVQPSATGRIAKLVYTPGSGWATPRFEVEWTYSDADGQPQQQYEIDIKTDSGGSPTGTTMVSGQVTSSAVKVVPTLLSTPVENTRYHIRVRVFDGLEWSAYSGYFIVRARWGLSTHRKDVSIAGAAPTTWLVSALHTTADPTKQAVVVEYNSSDDGTTNLAATWAADLSTLVKRKFVHYRVWLLYWGTSPGSSGSLDDITFTASGNVIQPDNWLPSPLSGVGGSIELSDHWFGTQALRIDGNGTSRVVYQLLAIEPNQNYVLQTRVKSVGNSGGYVGLSDTPSAAGLVMGTTPVAATADWAQETAGPWNSGSRAQVYAICVVTGAASTSGLFDGLKLERGTVTSPWTASTLADQGVLDAGGVQVDASVGGIFRLKSSVGGTRDRVDHGASGLKFGGDTEVASPSTGVLTVGGVAVLKVGDVVVPGIGTSFPGSPTTGQKFWRSDLRMEFFFDGTRWLSSVLYRQQLTNWNITIPTALSATTSAYQRTLSPELSGGSDLWLENYVINFFISGGTALSASHRWALTLSAITAGVGTADTLGSYSINSGAINSFRRQVVALNMLMDNGTIHVWFQTTADKLGTPGSFQSFDEVTYRIVAT